MKFFTRNEMIVVILCIIFVVGLTLANLQVADMRARDARRRADVRDVANAVDQYKSEFAFYPPGKDGQILACKGDKYDELVSNNDVSQIKSFFDLLRPCIWGQDSLVDLAEGKIYLKSIPLDPKASEGGSYLYLSNGRRFQIYTHLEAQTEAEQYNGAVFDRNLKCGSNICNYGLASDGTPVDRSIEEYEAELAELEKAKNAK